VADRAKLFLPGKIALTFLLISVKDVAVTATIHHHLHGRAQ